MYARIQEISTLSGTSMTYVLIHIWPTKTACEKGEKPAGDNQFVMDLFTTDQRVVQDENGRYKRQDGIFTDPSNAKPGDLWELETYNVDVPSEIKANIEDYLTRRKKLEGTEEAFPNFHARPALTRCKDDPRGILSQSDVMALVGGRVIVK